MSATSPSSRRPSQSGSARPLLILFLAVLSFAAGAATMWWYLTEAPVTPTGAAKSTPAPDFGPLTPPTLTPVPEAQPSPEAPAAAAAEQPPPATAAGAAKAPPGRRAAAKPPVATPAPVVPVAQLLSQAESAETAKRFTDAADLYDRALKLDPRNEAARAGRARVSAPGTSRSFVLGTTVVESLRTVGRDLAGFDTSGVGVKRAPKVEGQIELVMQPPRVKAGDAYAVMVFLKNDGKKSIEVDEMKVSMIVDGAWSTRPLPPKAKQVAPKQRVLLEELPGIWKAGVNDWAVEAVVTSKNQDVYRNRLTWK